MTENRIKINDGKLLVCNGKLAKTCCSSADCGAISVVPIATIAVDPVLGPICWGMYDGMVMDDTAGFDPANCYFDWQKIHPVYGALIRVQMWLTPDLTGGYLGIDADGGMGTGGACPITTASLSIVAGKLVGTVTVANPGDHGGCWMDGEVITVTFT